MMKNLVFPDKITNYTNGLLACNHSRTKQYIWNALITHLRLETDAKKPEDIPVLDAACSDYHCRHFFPETNIYHGIDLSRERLKAMLPRKRAKDILIHGNITEKHKELESFFEIVVSTNTLTHLDPELRNRAIDALSDYVRPGGSFILNCFLTAGIGKAIKTLCTKFARVECLFTQRLLESDGVNNGDDYSNVNELLMDVEKYEIQWDAYTNLFKYRQVMLICKNRLPNLIFTRGLEHGDNPMFSTRDINYLAKKTANLGEKMIIPSYIDVTLYIENSKPEELVLISNELYNRLYTKHSSCDYDYSSNRDMHKELRHMSIDEARKMSVANLTRYHLITFCGFEMETIGASETEYTLWFNRLRSTLPAGIHLKHLVALQDENNNRLSISCLQRD
jgi:hypothetical protein